MLKIIWDLDEKVWVVELDGIALYYNESLIKCANYVIDEKLTMEATK
jgi:hypothetical protein